MCSQSKPPISSLRKAHKDVKSDSKCSMARVLLVVLFWDRLTLECWLAWNTREDQDGFKLTAIHLPPLPECWDYRCVASGWNFQSPAWSYHHDSWSLLDVILIMVKECIFLLKGSSGLVSTQVSMNPVAIIPLHVSCNAIRGGMVKPCPAGC